MKSVAVDCAVCRSAASELGCERASEQACRGHQWAKSGDLETSGGPLQVEGAPCHLHHLSTFPPAPLDVSSHSPARPGEGLGYIAQTSICVRPSMDWDLAVLCCQARTGGQSFVWENKGSPP